MSSLDAWLAGGRRVVLEVPSGRFELFVREQGSGPWLTFFHGFPTSSFDWSKIAPLLSGRRLLFVDWLGYGDSDKPAGHRYTVFEQSELAAALWRSLGVAETALVAHDYGVTVAMEVVARLGEGAPLPRLPKLVLLNSGLYADLYRPLAIQKLLLSPLTGPLLSLVVNERSFRRSFRSLYSPRFMIDDAELHEHWLAIARRDGPRRYHALIQYIRERAANKERWQGALESGRVPMKFLWGMVDPVSGGHVAAHLRERIPGIDLVAWDDVGHYPQLEVPERVAAAIAGWL